MAVDINGFFPRYIDKPKLVGVFEIDEFFLAFGILALIMAGSLMFPKVGSLPVMLTALFTAGTAAYSYKKFKDNKPDGFTAHWAYKKGIYHPQDNKFAELSYPYLKKNRTVPYGFTKVLYS